MESHNPLKQLKLQYHLLISLVDTHNAYHSHLSIEEHKYTEPSTYIISRYA